MSNLRIDNIAPSAGGTYRNAPRGIAAAWVSFTGITTTAIYNSENISSLTDLGTATTRLNFTNAFVDAFTSFTFGGSFISGVSEASDVVTYNDAPYTQTTSTITVKTINGSNAGSDMPRVSVEMNGDLA